MTAHESSPQMIPTSLLSGLRQLLHRYRRTVVLKGVSASLVVFITGMLIVITLDRMFIMPRWLRVGLTVLVWALTGRTLWLYLVGPLLRIPPLSALAASVEAVHPELQEEVSSAVELLSAEDRPEYRGSDELIEAVVQRLSLIHI